MLENNKSVTNSTVVIIPTYKIEFRIKPLKLLLTILSNNALIEKIIIVDYGSNPLVLRKILTETHAYFKTIVLKLNTDYGPLHMRLVGALYAMKRLRAKIIVFIDSDALPCNNTIEKIIAKILSGKCDITAPLIIGSECDLQSRGLLLDFSGKTFISLPPATLKDKPCFVFSMGAVVAISSKILYKYLPFYNREFSLLFWYDDADLFLTLAKSGARICIESSAPVIHLEKQSLDKQVDTSMHHYIKLYEKLYAARIVFVWRHFTFTEFLMAIPLIFLDILLFSPYRQIRRRGLLFSLKGVVKGLKKLIKIPRIKGVLPKYVEKCVGYAIGLHIKYMIHRKYRVPQINNCMDYCVFQ